MQIQQRNVPYRDTGLTRIRKFLGYRTYRITESTQTQNVHRVIAYIGTVPTEVHTQQDHRTN
jgi:hypothetical protein